MDPREIEPQRIREQIDACRPHEDGLAPSDQLELAKALVSNLDVQQAYDRSRHWDALVVRAVRDTPPTPAGLAERLLAAAREQEVSQKEPHFATAIVEQCIPAITSKASSSDISVGNKSFAPSMRRRLAVKNAAKIALALMLCLAIGSGVYWYRTPLPITRDGLSAQAATWVATISQDWQPLEKAPLKYFPTGSAITNSPIAWQSVDLQNGYYSVVYDLQRGRGRAYLFVVRTNASSPFSATPSRLPSSGGWGVGAWKNGDSLYVLIVDEGRQRLEEFIRQPRTVAQSHSSPLPLS